MASATFLESATAATGGFEFWDATGGTTAPTSETTTVHTGLRSIKTAGVSNGNSFVKKNSILPDAGGAVSFYVRFSALPTTENIFFKKDTSGGAVSPSIQVGHEPDKTLSLVCGGSNTFTSITVDVNTWTRICVSYQITDSTHYTVKLYIDGVLAATRTTGTIQTSQTSLWLQTGGDSTDINTFFSDIYIDDRTDNTDPGDIRVTRKKPVANNTNNFDTAIGTNNANRYLNVDDVPIDATQGWQHAAATDVQENYGLEAASAGDVDVSAATIVARCAWLWGKRGAKASVARQQNVSADAATVNISTPAANDLILVFAYNNGSTTIPTLPGGYTSAGTQNPGGSANACRIGWKLAAGSETNTSTWTNATNIVCLVFRNVDTVTTVGTPTGTAGNSATLTYGSVTGSAADGTSIFAGFGGAKAATAGMSGNPGTTPAMTTRANQTVVNGGDTAAGTNNLTSGTLAITGSGRWLTETIEILAGTAGSNTEKIMDNGSESAITLTTSAALYTLLSTSATYPSNAAGIGMRSTAGQADTFLYDCGTLLAYILSTYPAPHLVQNTLIRM